MTSAPRAAKSPPPTASDPGSCCSGWFVLATAFTSGAIVLALEVCVPRVLQSFFGVGLYVWTATISVTLLALAVGYVIGGRVADRTGGRASPAWPLIVGGLVAAAVPLLRTPILWAVRDWDLRAGVLTSTVALLFPALTLLGMTGPLLIGRISARGRPVGRAVGAIFGSSTVGSVVGAVVTGFVLIDALRLDLLIPLLGAASVALGAVWVVLDRKTIASAAAIALLAAVATSAFASPRIHGPWEKGPHRIVHVENTFYGEIRVADIVLDVPGFEGGRMLLVDGREQAFLTHDFVNSWHHYATDVEMMRAFRPAGKDVLLVGLGSGQLAKRLSSRGLRVEAVEIDPAIVDVARRFFGFDDETISVHVGDGRYFVECAPKDRYDFVVFNAFSGDALPGHLYTAEAIRAVERALKPGGVFVTAFFGRLDDTGAAANAVHATLGDTFDSVRVFTHDHSKDKSVEAYYFASNEPLEADWNASLDKLLTPETERLRDLDRNCGVRLDATDAVVLTDNYNPLDRWLRDAALTWFEEIKRNYGVELLLASPTAGD